MSVAEQGVQRNFQMTNHALDPLRVRLPDSVMKLLTVERSATSSPLFVLPRATLAAIMDNILDDAHFAQHAVNRSTQLPTVACSSDSFEFRAQCDSVCRVNVLGVTHSSLDAAMDVMASIVDLKPTIVCLESCMSRTMNRVAHQMPAIRAVGGNLNLLISQMTVQDLATSGFYLNADDVALANKVKALRGAPELTAIYECERRGIQLESVDILESVKVVQNASILSDRVEATRRIGSLPESVLRHSFDDQVVSATYLNLIYGLDYTDPHNSLVLPSEAYRIIECSQRSTEAHGSFAVNLLRVLQPKHWWSEIHLRDLYMSWRIRKCVARLLTSGAQESTILVIVGANHVEGIKKFLSQEQMDMKAMTAAAMSTLIDDASVLFSTWKDLLLTDPFSEFTGKTYGRVSWALSAAVIGQRILTPECGSVRVCSGLNKWDQVEVPYSVVDTQTDFAERLKLLTTGIHLDGKPVDLIKALGDGLVDPYTEEREFRAGSCVDSQE